MEKIEEVIYQIGEIDSELEHEAQEHLDKLTKPQGSLGKLEWLAKKIVGITGTMRPSLTRKVIFTMAADHGVVREGVSAYPQEVTIQMVRNFLAGGAAINVLAEQAGVRVEVADLGVKGEISCSAANFHNYKVAAGTRNFVQGPAMTREEAVTSIERGIEMYRSNKQKGIDILGVGDMGIGNTTASSAIAAVILTVPVRTVVGRGTGISDEAYANKIKVIEQALKINQPDRTDALDILGKVGGFEIGGIAGAILAAAADRVPVVIDGFIATAGALLAGELAPAVKPYLIASHLSQEAGHQLVLDYLALEPILYMDLRLGEGTGAALAMNIIEASIRIFTKMATFTSAGVSEKT